MYDWVNKTHQKKKKKNMNCSSSYMCSVGAARELLPDAGRPPDCWGLEAGGAGDHPAGNGPSSVRESAGGGSRRELTLKYELCEVNLKKCGLV